MAIDNTQKKTLNNPSSDSSKNGAKGANKKLSAGGSKKNVLGKGLGALMAASAVKVDIEGRDPSEASNRKSFSFKPSNKAQKSVFKPGAGVPRPEDLQRSISREQAFIAKPLAETKKNEIAPAPEGGLVYLDLSRVVQNPKQPRKHFSEKELKELASSIRLSGVLQPIVVRRQAGVGGPLAKYEIIAGERRFRAATKVGITRIPALVRQMSDREVLEVSIVENVQRENLNPIEEAMAYSRLVAEFGSSQEEVASAVGKSRSAVANAMRLLKLNDEIQKMLLVGELSAGHAKALLMVESDAKRVALARAIVKETLSVRDTEQRASELNEGITVVASSAKAKKTKIEKDAATVSIEQRLRRTLGTKVKLQRKKNGSGELRISFFSDEELESIIEHIK